MAIRELINILACPVCKSSLKYDKNKLICLKCRKKYVVKEGIPLLISQAGVA